MHPRRVCVCLSVLPVCLSVHGRHVKWVVVRAGGGYKATALFGALLQADTLVTQGMAQKSRFFRELSDYNKAGPLESCYTATSRSTCCPQMHTLTLTTAAAVGLRCDVCRRAIASAEAIYSCAPCDFDACDCCGGNSDGPTVTYSTRAAVAPSIELLPKDLTTEVPEGNQAMGRHLSVLWLEERPPTRFSGVIKQYNPANNEHLVCNTACHCLLARSR